MKINIDKHLHQDNLKAEIYHQFKLRFLTEPFALVCEYRVDKSRFDLTAYNTDTLDVIALIEVRRIGVKKPPRVFGRKHLKYAQYGCNILYISEFGEVDNLLDDIEFCSALKETENVLG